MRAHESDRVAHLQKRKPKSVSGLLASARPGRQGPSRQSPLRSLRDSLRSPLTAAELRLASYYEGKGSFPLDALGKSAG